jgi:SSS family solute:Na+ symporter
MNFGSNFTALDWAIVAVYLAGTAVVGVLASRYVTNMADYVVAGRSLKSYLGVASMIGTEFGLVSVATAAQLGFTGGLSALHLGILGLVVTLAVGLSGVVLVPLRRAGVMTIPEFYERRFSRGVRVFGAAVMVLAGVTNIAVFVPVSARFLAGLTGLTDPLHVNLFMTGLVVLVFAYTALGGMVSVIIADYLQCVFMSAALLLVCGIAVYTLGWGNITSTMTAVHGEAGVNPLHEAGFGPTYLVWMAVVAFASCALWQTTVIRACSAEDERTVKRVITGSAVAFMGRQTIPILLGVCALAYVAGNPQMRAYFLPGGGKPDSETALMALPAMLANMLPAGLIGLVAAGMIAAFLSTQDSYMLCWSAVFVQDVVAPCTAEPLSTAARLRLSRLFLLVEAVITVVFGLWYPLSQRVWDYMAITGAVYFVGAASVLVLGIYWRRASTVGAYLAIATGFGAFLGLDPVQRLLGIKVPAEQLGLSLIGLSFVAMFGGSLLFPDKRDARRPAADRSAAT